MGIVKERSEQILEEARLLAVNNREGLSSEKEIKEVGGKIIGFCRDIMREHPRRGRYMEDFYRKIGTIGEILRAGNIESVDEVDLAKANKAKDLAIIEEERNECAIKVLYLDNSNISNEAIDLLYKMIECDLKLPECEISDVTDSVLDSIGCAVIKNPEAKESESIIQDIRTGDVLIKGKKEPGNMEGTTLPLREGDRIDLKIPVSPHLSLREKRQYKEEIEAYLFRYGARYEPYTISADISHTGREIRGRNWYIIYHDGVDLSVFTPYLKDRGLVDLLMKTGEGGRNFKGEGEKEGRVKYLFIPPGPHSVYKMTVKCFEQNGAKYDPDKKKWYIPSDVDEAVFEGFLEPI